MLKALARETAIAVLCFLFPKWMERLKREVREEEFCKAVLKQVGSNDRYVFVEKDGKAVYTLVQLGVRMDDKYEIVSGLNAGDYVITEGHTDLVDGKEVEVVE